MADGEGRGVDKAADSRTKGIKKRAKECVLKEKKPEIREREKKKARAEGSSPVDAGLTMT